MCLHHVMLVALALLGTSKVAIARKVKAEKRNVYGEPLEPCSRPSMGNTGFVRDGSCIFVDLDEGFHTVCVDVPSFKGGNFCDVTNQKNWCDRSMPCTEDSNYYCPVDHWCVEEWAFEDYVHNAAKGCDDVGHIYCESTNMVAVLNYEKLAKAGDPKARKALECLKEKCWLP